jgi:hypothetical protein
MRRRSFRSNHEGCGHAVHIQRLRQSAFRVDVKRGEGIAVALQKRFNMRRLIVDDEA